MPNFNLRNHAVRRIEEEWDSLDFNVNSAEPEQVAAWMLMTAKMDDAYGNAVRAAKLRREAYEILSENHPATFPFRLDSIS